MIETRDNRLYVDGHTVSRETENQLIRIIDKASKYDELKATFEEGDA